MADLTSTKLNFVTIFTLLMTGAWVVSFVVRVFDEKFVPPATVDAGMLLVLGYWFSTNALRRSGS